MSITGKFYLSTPLILEGITRQAGRFAEATGKLAKTDAIDAAMLARFGALLAPEIRQPVSETLDETKELHNAREALIKDRTATLNRHKQMQSKLLLRLTNQKLRQINSQLKAIDAEMNAVYAADPILKSRFDILISIPGIGEVTALSIIIQMPELGQLEAPQAASLAGLVPPSPAIAESGGENDPFAADEQTCDKPSICPLSSQPGLIQTSKQNTGPWCRPENHQKLQSSQSCERSSSLQMHSSNKDKSGK